VIQIVDAIALGVVYDKPIDNLVDLERIGPRRQFAAGHTAVRAESLS